MSTKYLRQWSKTNGDEHETNLMQYSSADFMFGAVGYMTVKIFLLDKHVEAIKNNFEELEDFYLSLIIFPMTNWKML